MNTAPQIQTAADYLKESLWLKEKRVGTLIKSVLAGKINFNTLEKELFAIAREYLLTMLGAILEHLDQLILYSAEREGWEVVEIRKRTIETTLGVLTYQRRYYKKRTLSGAYAYAFLLDEFLGLPARVHVSPRLSEIAVLLAAEQTYRKAAETLATALGVSISHETIHQDVQVAGEHLKKWDGETALDNTGTRIVPLLIIEVDGAMIKRQRRSKGQQRRFELKTAVIYEGWEEGPHGRAKLINPTYFVYHGTGEEFWVALERHLSRIYDLDGCPRKIIAGDGSDWVREGADLLGAEYQYCRFHLQRDLTSLFNPQMKRKIEKILKANDRAAFNLFLRTLITEEPNETRKEKLKAFQSFINSVWEGITDWRERSRPCPSPARGLGVIEPNVGHTIARRFKHLGASWSVSGADHLAHVRCAKRNGTLSEMLNLSGPPMALEKDSPRVQNGYWARRQTDGLAKKDPGDWLRASLPAAYGPDQRTRELAFLISRLTLDWLF
ncbi:MAG: ISLre2 family transposase [Bacillota bacterium]